MSEANLSPWSRFRHELFSFNKYHSNVSLDTVRNQPNEPSRLSIYFFVCCALFQSFLTKDFVTFSRHTALSTCCFVWLTSVVNGQYVLLITISQSTHTQDLFPVSLLVASAFAMYSAATNSELAEATFKLMNNILDAEGLFPDLDSLTVICSHMVQSWMRVLSHARFGVLLIPAVNSYYNWNENKCWTDDDEVELHVLGCRLTY